MATYNIRFYDADPWQILPHGTGNFSWTGPADAVGKATVNDPESGTEGLTLDDDDAGGESATAHVEINGDVSALSTVDAEEVWTVRDNVTGDVFQVATFQVENGDASGYYTISEMQLVPGRSYSALEFDSNPNVAAGDIAFSAADYVAPDQVVSGTDGNDSIDSAYAGDPQNDQVDDGFAGGSAGNDNVIEALGGNDTVAAGDGNDTIDAGSGDDAVDGGTGDDLIDGGTGADSLEGGTGSDTIFGGAGQDTLSGGDGNDALDGGLGDDLVQGGAGDDQIAGALGNDTLEGGDGNDTIRGGGGAPHTPSQETLDWSAQGSDGTSVAAGFTQNTGDIDVAVSFANDGNNNPTYVIETGDTAYVDAGEDYNAHSNLYLYGNGGGATSTTTLDFTAADGASVSDAVQNVSFRINDIDYAAGNHRDVITVRAYDADGNPVTVALSPDGNDTVSGNTITGGKSLDNPYDANGSVLVEIGGPVSRIEIAYGNAHSGTQAIYVSDVHFSTIPDPVTADADSLSGGAGDDVIDGDAGDDTIVGGTGHDTLTGGDGNDVFVLSDGAGSDIITDFDTGDGDGDGTFNDQLDLSGLTDASGAPINAWDITISGDASGNAVLTFPNGETLTLEGVAPADLNGAQWLNAAGVPCFGIGTLIRTPRGDVPVESLNPGDSITTLDHGPQQIRWTGRRGLGPRDLVAEPRNRPILIPAHVMGNYAPLLVSPQHGMMVELNGEQRFARAKHLAEVPGPVRIAAGRRSVTYVHLMLERHEVLFANGAPTESFYPGPQSLRMYPPRTVAALAALIPGLLVQPVEQSYGPTARPFLKGREARACLDLRIGADKRRGAA